MKTIRNCLCIFLTAVILLSCIGCSDIFYEEEQTAEPEDSSDTVTDSTETEVEENNVLDVVTNGTSEFAIVYPSLCDSSIKELAQKVQKTVKDYIGAELEMHSDTKKSRYEILIGDTSREETAEILGSLREKDAMLYVGEEKIVLVGGNEEYLKKAVAKFLQVIYSQGKKGTVNGSLQLCSSDNERVSYKYPASENYSINGNRIKEYIIVYDDASTVARYEAYVLQRTVLARVGYELPVYSESDNNSDKEILVGMTSRTEGSIEDQSFAVELQGNKLCLKFKDIVSGEQTIDHISNKVLIGGAESFSAENNYSARLSDVLTGSERTALGNTGDIRIVCNNIYQAFNYYEQRMTYLTMVYEEYAPDIICLQEAGAASWNKSADRSIHALMGELGYETITANGGKNNATPMIYNKNTLNLLESEYVQFTGANNSASKSFTWARFEVKATGKTFICFSTHFMYNSGNIFKPGTTEWNTPSDYTASLWKPDSPTTYEATRVQNAKELEAKVKELYERYDCPIFGGGDINSTWDTDAYKYMTETAGFSNVRDIADVSDAHIGTCHATSAMDEETEFFFDNLSEKDIKGEIDTLFAYGSQSKYHVNTHDILIHDFTAAASDHLPVMADIVLK